MKYLRKPRNMALWKVVVLDVLLVGVILVTFALFHHALPALITQYETNKNQVSTVPTSSEPHEEASVQTTPSQPESEPETTESTEQTEETTEPDNRTPWQIRFEDHFTDEVVTTENSYTSPEVSITIETVVDTMEGRKVTYYVADVYVASMENFRTYTAYGTFRYFGMEDAVEMTRDTNAILAISGDYLTNQKSGFLVRNGEVYVSDRNNGICVLYPDGTMETNEQGQYQVENILAREPLQVWSFGPALLDENGKVMDSYDVAYGISGFHPRCAIGYYEPGHYCFIVADGRQNHSAGMKISELAQVFEDLGCKVAYNLDGGASAVMLFGQQRYSKPSNGGRDLGDIILITESGNSGEDVQ